MSNNFLKNYALWNVKIHRIFMRSFLFSLSLSKYYAVSINVGVSSSSEN